MKLRGRTAIVKGGELRAIAVICSGVLLLSLNDALSKTLVERYEPLQILLVRSIVALPFVIALAWVLGGRGALRSPSIRVHALRGLLTVGAGWTFIGSLGVLPLAEATVLIFTISLFVALLSWPLLGERVGWRRGFSLAIGFAGVVVIVQPGTDAFQPAALLALAAALISALLFISARWIVARDSIWTMLLYMTVFSGVFSAFTVFRPWPEPMLADALLFAGAAILGPLGMALISQAFRMAPAALVAPFNYTGLLWATIIGWVVWGAIPGPWTYVGATAIIAAGLYLIVWAPPTGAGDQS